MYRIAGNFRQGKISPNSDVLYCEKISPDLFSHTCDWAKLNSTAFNYSFQHGSLAVSSSLKKCLAAAESPFSLAIWTSVHYLVSYKVLFSPL